jgi:hypothetical protein
MKFQFFVIFDSVIFSLCCVTVVVVNVVVRAAPNISKLASTYFRVENVLERIASSHVNSSEEVFDQEWWRWTDDNSGEYLGELHKRTY